MADESEFVVPPVSGVAAGRRGRSGRWSLMVSVLGFVTWSSVHLTVGISRTVMWFNF